MPFFITKASGEQEEFSFRKLHRSLRKAGATDRFINQIIAEVKHIKPTSTQQIHEYAISRLAQENPPIAARYNLKRALMQLGPAGFPFERFVSKLLQGQGYDVEIGQEIDGSCVHHEVDVVATNKNEKCMVECKFHNSPGLKTDVKVMLYVRARFEDIAKKWEQEAPKRALHAWVFSNTQFTIDAIQYATCIGMRLTGWGYPIGQSLAEMIDKQGMHPITALTKLNYAQKRTLIEQGLVLCKDIEQYRSDLSQLGFTQAQIETLCTEAHMVCSLQSEGE